jgi:hypothetical protein
VHLLAPDSDPRVQVEAAKALTVLAREPPHVDAIADAGAIPALLALFGPGIDAEVRGPAAA